MAAEGRSLPDREAREALRNGWIDSPTAQGIRYSDWLEGDIIRLRVENERLTSEHKARGEAIVRLEIETEEIDRLREAITQHRARACGRGASREEARSVEQSMAAEPCPCTRFACPRCDAPPSREQGQSG